MDIYWTIQPQTADLMMKKYEETMKKLMAEIEETASELFIRPNEPKLV